jgi:hypothetical protein
VTLLSIGFKTPAKGVRHAREDATGFLAALVGVGTLAVTAQAGPHFSAWGPAQKVDEIAGNSSELNMPFLDGCPIRAPAGLSLYMASNRPGGHGASSRQEHR